MKRYHIGQSVRCVVTSNNGHPVRDVVAETTITGINKRFIVLANGWRFHTSGRYRVLPECHNFMRLENMS